jgi:hypothetical protein
MELEFKPYENLHVGERCFVLGSGASLRKENLSLLANEYVFACNKSFLSVDLLGLPHYNYYVLTDSNVYGDVVATVKKEFSAINVPRFYSDSVINSRHEIIGNFVRLRKGKPRLGDDIFPRNFDDTWGATGTVVFEAVLTAYCMGFSHIYMLGVDFDYSNQNDTHFYTMGEREHSAKFNMIRGFKTITQSCNFLVSNFDKLGISLINLSKGFSRLDLLPTGKLEDIC